MIANTTNSFFAQPKFIVGKRAMEHIPVELDGLNSSRPLVITSKLQRKKATNQFVKALAESDVSIGALYENNLSYVNSLEIERLAGLYTWTECDSVVAIGGSEALDIAKALAICVRNEKVFSQEHISSQRVPLVYVATSQINGYEVTGSINIDGKRFFSDTLFPDLVCIDNRMLIQSAYGDLVGTALISLTTCIEGVAVPGSNPFSESAAFSALQLICTYLPKLIKKQNDTTASVAVVNGIAIAGTVLHNTKPGIVGLASRFLSKQTGYNQGLIAGHLIKALIRFKLDNSIPVRSDLLLALAGMDFYSSVSKERKGIEALKYLTDFVDSLYQPNYLTDIYSNIQLPLLEKAAEYVAQETGGLIPRAEAMNLLLLAKQKPLKIKQ